METKICFSTRIMGEIGTIETPFSHLSTAGTSSQLRMNKQKGRFPRLAFVSLHLTLDQQLLASANDSHNPVEGILCSSFCISLSEDISVIYNCLVFYFLWSKRKKENLINKKNDNNSTWNWYELCLSIRLGISKVQYISYFSKLFGENETKCCCII